MDAHRQQGFTLIELVISIVVVSVALAGVLLVMNQTVLRSADPMIMEQAVAIAEAYMEEIMTKEYADPDGVAEVGRTLWDDVGDYDKLAEAPTGQNGPPRIAGLGAYAVTVAVGAPAAVAGEPMRLITVTVTQGTTSYTLSSYRSAW